VALRRRSGLLWVRDWVLRAAGIAERVVATGGLIHPSMLRKSATGSHEFWRERLSKRKPKKGHLMIRARLYRAVSKIESNCHPRVASYDGGRGLMQLMPETAERLGDRDISDPRENIFGVVR